MKITFYTLFFPYLYALYKQLLCVAYEIYEVLQKIMKFYLRNRDIF